MAVLHGVMSDQNRSESKKGSNNHCDSTKKQKTDAIVDVNSILQNCERSQVNNEGFIVASTGSNVQSKNIDNYPTNACSDANLNSSASSSSKEVKESIELRKWIKDSKVPYAEADKLLVILREKLLPSLPHTSTFLESIKPAEVWLKMENEDALQNAVADQPTEENDGTQGFMFVDMSHKSFSQVLEQDDCNLNPDLGVQILQLLKENSQRLSRIEEKQNQLIKFITSKKLADVSEIGLETMYDLQIPLISLEKFDDFEKQLEENELLQTDVCAQLATCIDRKDCSLSKSFTNILRTFMSRDVVMQFTARRKSTKSDKRQFSTTRFYKLMSGVLIKCRKERNLPHDAKDLNAALSEVISHANQWNV